MDKYERRRRRVLELIKLKYDNVQARFAEAIERDANYVSRMLYEPQKAGRKRIAEDMKDRIERACSLPAGWLDMPEGTLATLADLQVNEPSAPYKTSPWPFEKVTPAQWQSLSTAEREVVEGVALAIAARTRSPTRKQEPANSSAPQPA